VIVLQQSTEPLTRQHAPVADRPRRQWHDQLIAQTLMIPFVMIVFDELGDGLLERWFTDENDAIQAGFLDGRYEALGVRMEIGGMGRQAHDLHAAAASVSRNATVNSGSRSWIKKRLPVRKPSVASVRLRLTWVNRVLGHHGQEPKFSVSRPPNASSKAFSSSMTSRPEAVDGRDAPRAEGVTSGAIFPAQADAAITNTTAARVRVGWRLESEQARITLPSRLSEEGARPLTPARSRS
jgi:hypothetical protein